MAPWLSLLLLEVGAPEGWAVRLDDITDTGSALHITPPQYEGRVDVYVHAGAPDPEHDPTRGAQPWGRIGGFRLYQTKTERVEIFHAASPDVWLTLYVYPFGPRTGSVELRGDASARVWIRDMIAAIEASPIPLC